MKAKYIFIIFCASFLLGWKDAGPQKKQIDLVFCLDMSASTNGMLHEVRDKIWNISNGMLRKYEAADLRIGIAGYGRPSFGSDDGYVRIISGLTNDLDRIHYELHQLRAVIERGDQYVPDALLETFKQIKWSKNPDAEKIVFLIGNGSVYAGRLNLEDVCEKYREKNIAVNTLYVSKTKESYQNMAGYKKIAEITKGTFFTIKPPSRVEVNKNLNEAYEIIRMNNALNSTYMFFTKDAADHKKYQEEADKNTLKMGVDFFYSRLLYKTSEHYAECTAAFDLPGYISKYKKLPERMNYAYLTDTEKTTDFSVIENKARKKSLARRKLHDEIRGMFHELEKDSVIIDKNLLDGCVLSNYLSPP